MRLVITVVQHVGLRPTLAVVQSMFAGAAEATWSKNAAAQKSGAVQKGDPIQQGGPIQTEAIEGEVPPPPTAAAYYIESGRIGFYQVGFRR